MPEPHAPTGGRTWTKPVLWALGGACAATAVLFAAAQLDELERPTRSAEAGSGADLFVVEVAPQERPVLVVECDEGVQGDANARFRRFLGVTSAPIAIPGGPLLLAKLPEELTAEQGPVARSAVEVLERYAPAKVILIAHSDCLLYDVGGAWEGHPELVPVAQQADLAKAAANLRAWLPSTAFEAYYARTDGTRIRYNAVTLPPRGEVR